jgi:hypothetical protein
MTGTNCDLFTHYQSRSYLHLLNNFKGKDSVDNWYNNADINKPKEVYPRAAVSTINSTRTGSGLNSGRRSWMPATCHTDNVSAQ